MDRDHDLDGSQLFLIRLWGADIAGERGSLGETSTVLRGQIHGKVQHVLSGKASGFTDCSSLINILYEMIAPMSIAAADIFEKGKNDAI